MQELLEKKYYTIGEICRQTSIPAYTLRYWESQFKILRPIRKQSGPRRFTQKDINAILEIKDLLFLRGFTLAGAKKMLRGRRNCGEKTNSESALSADSSNLLQEVHKELQVIIKDLEEGKR